MLDRVVSDEKEKYQIYLPKEMIRDIRKAAADAYQTQSKYIADLVVADLVEAKEISAIFDRLVLTLGKAGYDFEEIHQLVAAEYDKQSGA